jgi:Uma2 family endonuclease
MSQPAVTSEKQKDSAIVPLLEAGDQLTRPEFERRYDAMPELKKAELIEGEVYMPSPVRLHQHGRPHADFIGWLVYYRANTPGVLVGDNVSIRLDMENEPQPDATLIIEPTYGGQARVDDEDYVVGGPEFAGEISASTASVDLHKKLRVYRRNQVKEYLVWRVLDNTFDWFIQREGNFDRLPLSASGFFQSEVFPGLWLDPVAMANGDMVKVFQVLNKGLATPEHAAFVEELARRQSRAKS